MQLGKYQLLMESVEKVLLILMSQVQMDQTLYLAL
jgi:hypothetical protein